MKRRERERVARDLLTELTHMRLQVIKFRKDDVFIRCPLTQNPDWYQRLCKRHERTRTRYPKSRTIIKRYLVVRALQRVVTGTTSNWPYDERLADILDEEVEHRMGVVA